MSTLLNENDAENMADFVTVAVYAQAVKDTSEANTPFSDLSAAEQAQFRLIAYAAMAAHDAWLVQNGLTLGRISKPGDKKPVVPVKRPELVGLNGERLTGKA